MLQVHHAACDGKAVFQVLDDFVRSYARVVDHKDARIELSPCDAEALRGRGTFGLTVLKCLRMLPAQLSGLSGVWQFFLRRPVPLLAATDAISGELPASFPDMKVDRLEAEEVRNLSAAAADSKVTVNDWLLRDFFLAVADFRARHQAAAAREWISFAVPMNLRQAADRRMPAANVVSMVFLQPQAGPDRRSGRPATEHPCGNGLDLPSPVGSDLRIVAFSPAGAAGRTGKVDQAWTLRSDLRRF